MIDFSIFGPRRVPFVPASEHNECGLACLAAVSEYFRGEFGLVEIRQLALHSGRGETLLAIRDLAERIGLSARAVRIGVSGLRMLTAPAILHWEMNHFVVLERVARNGIVIMDPAAGRMEVTWDEVDKSFTGVVLTLATSERWRIRLQAPRKTPALSFLGPLSRWRGDIAVIVALSLLMEALVLIAPLQMQMSIDNAVQAADGRLVWLLGAGFGFVVVIQACISVLRAWAAAVFGTRVNFDLHDRFVQKLHRKTSQFFMKHHTADILSRGRSVDTIQTLLSGQLIQVVLDSLVSVVMVVVMFIAVPWMAAVVIGFGLANVGVTTALRHAAIDNSRRYLYVAAGADALFLENVRASRAITLYGKETVRTSLWRNKFVELSNLALAGGRLQMFSAQAALLTNGMGNVALISLGAWLVLDGAITLGTMMMFFVFRAFFVERLTNCVSFLMQLRLMQTHAERIEEVLADDGATAREAERPPFVAAPNGACIEVRDVWFRYGADSPWILQGVSCRIEPGESVAITGPSGSGKTTLMNIMLGLLEPERGEVLIDGRPLKTIAPADYARIIGVVMQDDILFQGAVADNISFFDAPPDRERVMRAAERANIAREIQAMPMQYYSLLAEGASDISGGQKQRLFIARALYHDPSILFLDEATSHLDAESERAVSQAVKAMNLTRVLIAHRKETIATADRVLVMTASGTVAPREERPGLRPVSPQAALDPA